MAAPSSVYITKHRIWLPVHLVTQSTEHGCPFILLHKAQNMAARSSVYITKHRTWLPVHLVTKHKAQNMAARSSGYKAQSTEYGCPFIWLQSTKHCAQNMAARSSVYIRKHQKAQEYGSASRVGITVKCVQPSVTGHH
jgi:hypothetical protein